MLFPSSFPQSIFYYFSSVLRDILRFEMFAVLSREPCSSFQSSHPVAVYLQAELGCAPRISSFPLPSDFMQDPVDPCIKHYHSLSWSRRQKGGPEEAQLLFLRTLMSVNYIGGWIGGGVTESQHGGQKGLDFFTSLSYILFGIFVA